MCQAREIFKTVSEEFFMILLLYLFHNHLTNFLLLNALYKWLREP